MHLRPSLEVLEYYNNSQTHAPEGALLLGPGQPNFEYLS